MSKSKLSPHQQLFTMIDDSYVVVTSNYIKTPMPVFTYKSELYVSHGMGFLRLRPEGKTSKTTVFWEDLHVPGYTTKAESIYFTVTRTKRTPIAAVK